MHRAIMKLLSIAGDPIGDPIDKIDALKKWGALGKELVEMLKLKNGFYAFESALLVRALHYEYTPLGLLEWNAPNLWRSEFTENLGDILFFAEDIFGGQYCLREDKIWTFDPENGLFEAMNSSLAEWANNLISDYNFWTGYPLAHAWQMKKGILPKGMRLIPKTPFIFGGKYEVENLYSISDVKGMLFRESIANQIRDLPDGAEIVLKKNISGQDSLD